MIFAGLSGACYFLVGGTAESIPWWLYFIFGVAVLNFVAGMVFFFSMLVKAVRESRAGYTTSAGLYPELPQLDRSGRVLRTPAERAEYMANHGRTHSD